MLFTILLHSLLMGIIGSLIFTICTYLIYHTSYNNISQQLMPALILDLKLKTNLEEIFLKDPKSDLFLLMGKQIIPVHLKLLVKESNYFRQIVRRDSKKEHKIQIIQETFNFQAMISVLKLYYGSQLTIMRDTTITEILPIIYFFGIETLLKKLDEDMQENFDEYDFFVLLQLAIQYKFKNIEEICWERLRWQKFEQINYNRFDLLKCKQQLFIQILRQYIINMKRNDSEKVVRSLLREYNIFHRKNISLAEIIDLSSVSEEVEQNFEDSLNQNSNNQMNEDKDLSTQLSPSHLACKQYSFADFGTNFEKTIYNAMQNSQNMDI